MTTKLDLAAIRQDAAAFATVNTTVAPLCLKTIELCFEVERLRKALQEIASGDLAYAGNASEFARKALDEGKAE